MSYFATLNRIFACRIVNVGLVELTSEEFERRVAQEVAALQMVEHRNNIKPERHFPDPDDPDSYLVVMQFAAGGQHTDRIVRRFGSRRHYTESKVSSILRSVSSHMHARRIVHGDLKPENLLYLDETDDTLAVADFGFAQV